VGLLIIVVLFAAVWLMFVLPARRRRTQHAGMQDGVEVGDEIISAGGIHGRVVEAADGTVRVEIAPSIVVTLDRRAIAAVAREVEVEAEEPEPEEAPEPEPEPKTPAEPR
jgi:preprotein translocase subunit YajC